MEHLMAQRLKQLRQDARLSQDQVADLVGVNRSVVTNWERARNTPSLPNLVKLAAILRTTLDYLVGRQAMPPDTTLQNQATSTEDAISAALHESQTALNRLANLLGTAAEKGDWRRVEILGTVSAGGPEKVEDVHLGWAVVPTGWLPRREEGFAIRVNGHSMAPVLENGDIAIVRRQPEAPPGNIVVAVKGGEYLVKYLERSQSGFQLRPEAGTYPTVPVDSTTRIQGRVVGLLRHLGR